MKSKNEELKFIKESNNEEMLKLEEQIHVLNIEKDSFQKVLIL